MAWALRASPAGAARPRPVTGSHARSGEPPVEIFRPPAVLSRRERWRTDDTGWRRSEGRGDEWLDRCGGRARRRRHPWETPVGSNAAAILWCLFVSRPVRVWDESDAPCNSKTRRQGALRQSADKTTGLSPWRESGKRAPSPGNICSVYPGPQGRVAHLGGRGRGEGVREGLPHPLMARPGAVASEGARAAAGALALLVFNAGGRREETDGREDTEVRPCGKAVRKDLCRPAWPCHPASRGASLRGWTPR